MPETHVARTDGSGGRTVVKNAGVLLASQAITWSLSLTLMVFLPRYLGAANVGRLALANSLWAIAMVLMTFGMDVHLTKVIARQPAKLRELLWTSFALRGVLFVLGLAGMAIYLKIVRYPAETVRVVAILAVANLFYLLNGACQAGLQGLERMEYVSLGNTAGKAVASLLAIASLLAGFGIDGVAVMLALGAPVTLLIEATAVLRILAVRPSPPAPPRRTGEKRWGLAKAGAEAWGMLSASLPYLLSDAFLVAYMQADVVILSLLLTEQAVGWYGAANQLFATLLFLPIILITAIFPTLSRLHATEPDLLRQYVRRSFDVLMLLAIPIGLGIVIVADPLVMLLFGREFVKSGPILAVLGVVLILTFQNMLLGRFLVATDRQRRWTTLQGVLGLATILLDLVLVPWCQRVFANGALGGALSYVVTELAMLVIGIIMLPRGLLGLSNASVAARSLAAGLLMVAATWWSRELFLGLPILLGALVYVGALWALRALPAGELSYLQHLTVDAVQRLRGREPQQAVAGREV